MATILDHDLAALEAKMARDAAETDEEKVRHDQAWAHHFTAANLMRAAQKHQVDARIMRRVGDYHDTKGFSNMARQSFAFADKSTAASEHCAKRAEVRAAAGHEAALVMREVKAEQ